MMISTKSTTPKVIHMIFSVAASVSRKKTPVISSCTCARGWRFGVMRVVLGVWLQRRHFAVNLEAEFSGIRTVQRAEESRDRYLAFFRAWVPVGQARYVENA